MSIAETIAEPSAETLLSPASVEIVRKAILAAAMPRILLSPAEAAQALGISTRTLYTWTVDEDLPFVCVNGTKKYRVDALQEWAARRETTHSKFEASKRGETTTH